MVRQDIDKNVSWAFGVAGATPVDAVKSGSGISYPEIMPHADVVYEAATGRAKETILLKSAAAPMTWTFPLRLRGLTAAIDSTGTVVLTDSRGVARQSIAPGYMEDSKIDPRSGEPARTNGVTYTLITVDGGPALRVTLDTAWIADPARVFPIKVDPSISNFNAGASTYVMRPFANNYSGASELKVGNYDVGAGDNYSNSFLTFNVGAAFPNAFIEAATLNLDNTHSYSCVTDPSRPYHVDPIYVSPITSPWTVNAVNTYPGPNRGAVIGQATFAGGDTCGGPAWKSIDIGDNPSAAGIQLLQSWAHGGQNLGLALTTNLGNNNAWKKFASVNSANPPYLSITYSPYGATYSAAGYYYQPTALLAGSQPVTITNMGNSTWDSAQVKLSYRLFDMSWNVAGPTPAVTSLPQSVGPNGSVSVTGVIGAMPPGQYILCWDMRINGTSFNTGYGVPTGQCQIITSGNTSPQITATNPPSNVMVGSLTPQLQATGFDPDHSPGALTYNFQVWTAPDSGSPVLVVDSGAVSASTYVVPTNKLRWNQTYSWTVRVSDSANYSAWSAPSYFSATVPQPLITSHLGAAAGRAHLDPGVGDFTTTETDAEVAVVGPALAVARAYNSLDPRTGNLFGAGWSTAYDMAATPDADGSGNVVVTFADGHSVRFGLNTDGSFVPPQGTYATFQPVSGGGYQLVDRAGTTYAFTRPVGPSWRLASITDTDQRAETFTYNTDGTLATITSGASHRALHLTWSSGHVSTVATDPVTTGGSALTWTYSYSGDTLTRVCPPTSATACANYGYTAGPQSGSHYRSMVLDAQPYAYWPLDDPTNATVAGDAVEPNMGRQNGIYSMAGFGHGPGPAPGSPTKSAYFGANAGVQLPDRLVSSASYLTVQLWFQTGTANGPGGMLFSTGRSRINDGTTDNAAVPVLYIGADGKLYGAFGNGMANPIASATKVNDGAWHQATLVGAGNTQTLYLDGAAIGSRTGQLNDTDPINLVGAGVFNTAAWPSKPVTGWSYFTGNIGQVAYYTHALGAPAIAQQYGAGTHSAVELVSITTPAGRTSAQLTYDPATDRATRMTDANGGAWSLAAPVTSGSSAGYRRALDNSGLGGFWQLDETSGAAALDSLSDYRWPSNGVYHAVTLGQPGPFPGVDETAAGFDGTSSYVDLGTAHSMLTYSRPYDSNPGMWISLWFKTSTPGGVLLGAQNATLGGNPDPDATPVFYIGSDGKLRAQMWDGVKAPIASPQVVTDGKWHFAMISAQDTGQGQILSVDGKQVGSRAASATTANPNAIVTIGAGNTGSAWPAAPSNPQGYFSGSIANIAVGYRYYEDFVADAKAQYKASGIDGSAPTTVGTTVLLTDPTGASIRYDYDTDNAGRLASKTDGLGARTRYTYDTNGFPYSMTDPDGISTVEEHDTRGNVLRHSRDLSDTIQYTYPAAGTYAVTDPRNDQPVTTADNRLHRNDDSITTYTYSTTGHLLTTTNAIGATTTQTYTTGTEPAVGGGNQPPGLLATVRDGIGRVTTNAYTTDGDLARVTTPSGLAITYSYDKLGRRLSQTETSDATPTGATTTVSYDGLGQPLTVTSPATTDAVTGTIHTRQDSLTYDADEQVLTTTTADLTGGDPARTDTNTYNTLGQRDSSTDPAQRATHYTYDLYGNLASWTTPDGRTFADLYDANGNLLTRTLQGWTGNPDAPTPATDLVVESRAYDPDGLLSSLTDSLGRTTTYDYDANGYLTAVHRPLAGADVWYSYDGVGNLVYYAASPGSVGTDIVRDGIGRVTDTSAEVFRADGAVFQDTDFTYNLADQITSRLVDAQISTDGPNIQQQTDYGYDAAGNLTTQTVHNAATTSVTSWTYDQRGLATSVTDPRGHLSGANPSDFTTTFGHDTAGRLVSTTAPVVQTETNGGAPLPVHPISLAGFNTFDELTSTSDPNGAITTNTYNADSELTAVSEPAYTPPGASSSITPTSTRTYTPGGLVASTTDPLGHTSTRTYDQLGNLTAITLPTIGSQVPRWGFTYDTEGEQLSVTDPTGARTEATYDAIGEPLTATEIVRQPTPTASTTTYTYNPSNYPPNLPYRITTPSGARTVLDYDGWGNVLSSTDPAGNTTTFDYTDFSSAPTTITAPDHTAVAFTHDQLGHTTTATRLTTTGATISTTSVGYDIAGNQTSVTNGTGTVQSASYDALNRITTRTTPVSAGVAITTGYGYDSTGNLTRTTDGAGNRTAYTYTPTGLLQSRVDPGIPGYTTPADTTTTLTYDAAGDLTAIAKPGNVKIAASYDALGRVTTTSGTGASVPTATRTFGYDLAGRLTTASTPAGTNTFSYDDRGLILNASGPGGNTAYAYNGDGLPTTRTDAAGTATFTYDTLGQLATETDPLTGTTLAYTRNPLGQITTVSHGTGTASETRTYDDAHRETGRTLTASNGTTLASISYGYDPSDHITSQTTTGTAGAAANTYGYDQSGRLTTWTQNGGTARAFTYDGAGNLTQAGDGITATYNARNQITAQGSRTFTYTARGTLASQTKSGSSPAATYNYDAFDQLASTKASGTTTNYGHDALGRLSTAGNRTFRYDGTSTLPVSDGTTTYARGPDGGVVSARTGSTAALLFTNQHGDVTASYAATGTALTGSTAFTPYGQTAATSGTSYGLGFQGGWTDPTTGYTTTASRMYNPATGSFTSQDTWTGTGAGNLYAYGDGDPLDYADPSGHSSCAPAKSRSSTKPASKALARRKSAARTSSAPAYDPIEARMRHQLAVEHLYGADSPAASWSPAPVYVHSDGVPADLAPGDVGWPDTITPLFESGAPGVKKGMPMPRVRSGINFFGIELPIGPVMAPLSSGCEEADSNTARANQKPINERPTGQVDRPGMVRQNGTKTGNSGPADEDPATPLENLNPETPEEQPFQPISQDPGKATNPGRTDGSDLIPSRNGSEPASDTQAEEASLDGLDARSSDASDATKTADPAARRVKLRGSTKTKIQDVQPKTADGDYIDPNTGQVIPRDGPFHYGHKPGFEWWRTRRLAREQGWTRKEVIDYENDWTHYQIEDPASNMSHQFELPGW